MITIISGCIFLTLTKEDGTLASTNEVMMMGINQHTRRSDAFPESFSTQIAHYYKINQLSLGLNNWDIK